jgi:hypothetical protein
MSSKTWKGVEASGSFSSRNSARQQDKAATLLMKKLNSKM